MGRCCEGQGLPEVLVVVVGQGGGREGSPSALGRACCGPLTSPPTPQPSLSLPTITDEEIKTGDPRETLRRASMQPTQIAEGAGITTRQQRKRVSSESHQGPGTPEVGGVRSRVLFRPSLATIKGEGAAWVPSGRGPLSSESLALEVKLSRCPPVCLTALSSQSKKATSCFPRPMTPRDRHEGRRQSTTEAQKKAAAAVVKQVGWGLEGDPAGAWLAEPWRAGWPGEAGGAPPA